METDPILPADTAEEANLEAATAPAPEAATASQADPAVLMSDPDFLRRFQALLLQDNNNNINDDDSDTKLESKPPVPKMGGLTKTGKTWTAWTGGKPDYQWVGLENPGEINQNPF